MAASESLREDQTTQDRGRDNKQTRVERKFIIINFLLIAILFLTSQPSAVLCSKCSYRQSHVGGQPDLPKNSCSTRLSTHGEYPDIDGR